MPTLKIIHWNRGDLNPLRAHISYLFLHIIALHSGLTRFRFLRFPRPVKNVILNLFQDLVRLSQDVETSSA